MQCRTIISNRFLGIGEWELGIAWIGRVGEGVEFWVNMVLCSSFYFYLK